MLLSVSKELQPLYQGLIKIYDEWSYHIQPDYGIETTDEDAKGVATWKLLRYLKTSTVYQTAMCIFAGNSINFSSDIDYLNTDLPSATVSGGICFFVDTLAKISDRPKSCHFLHVIPGTIQGQSGSHFDRVIDGETEALGAIEYEPIIESRDYTAFAERNEIPMQVDLLASESLRHITASLRFTSSRITAAVGPMRLKVAVLQSVALIRCRGRDCEPVDALTSSISVIEGEGYVCPEFDNGKKHVVVRKVASNAFARCLSVCRIKKPCIKGVPMQKTSDDVMMRQDECIPCTLRAGLSSRSDVVYITM